MQTRRGANHKSGKLRKGRRRKTEIYPKRGGKLVGSGDGKKTKSFMGGPFRKEVHLGSEEGAPKREKKGKRAHPPGARRPEVGPETGGGGKSCSGEMRPGKSGKMLWKEGQPFRSSLYGVDINGARLSKGRALKERCSGGKEEAFTNEWRGGGPLRAFKKHQHALKGIVLETTERQQMR